MLTLNLTEQAETDLNNIYKYSLNTWGQKQANNYLDETKKSFYLLLENPYLGKARHELKQGYRLLPLKKHIIFYSVCNEQLNILRILHARMDVNKNTFVS
ncbi:MAG: type II toxin-antitoxin system RelE/ParE family toxin [Methylococcaceae bacterium]|nr:type II toxin-antitoxin system RelE/ParE family toxin [Methylococcaceae bacterium]